MSKYNPLYKYLKNSGKDRILLSFKEIEDIIGDVLPESAYRYREWWANDRYHTQARNGWLSAGYHVEHVDFVKRIVVFRKSHVSGADYFMDIDWEDVIKSSRTRKIEITSPRRFEEFARYIMSRYFGKPLRRFRAPNWPKEFDLVSEALEIVGDAKYYKMVRVSSIPPAKFSAIAEHIWFLEKINAEIKFLVFGNDIRVPMEWLKRYGKYVKEVRFYFIDEEGNVRQLR